MPTPRLRLTDFALGSAWRVAVVRMPEQHPMGPHRHEFHELVVVTAGVAAHEADGRSGRLEAGDVFFIPRGHRHAYAETRGLSLVNLLLRDDFMRELAEGLGGEPGFPALFGRPAAGRRAAPTAPLRLTPAAQAETARLLREIAEELARHRPGSARVAEAEVVRLVALLCRQTPGPDPDQDSRWRVAQVVAHLQEHPTEIHTLDDLARRAGLSRRSLLRHFQRGTGRSPVAYLLDLRIRRAAAELLATRRSIKEIADACGFEDSNYFTRLFRRRTGLSPRAFRAGGTAAPAGRSGWSGTVRAMPEAASVTGSDPADRSDRSDRLR